MTDDELNPKQPPGPVTVDHVADACRCYPGETVTFYTRVSVWQPVAGFTLGITLPASLVPGDTCAPPDVGDLLPVVAFEDGARHLSWRVARGVGAGTRWEFQVQAQVTPVEGEVTLASRAVVTVEDAEAHSFEERATVAVSDQGSYLRYLPALYQSDKLMGRLLMLLESFWAPIKGQIDHMHAYFDPRMTPPEFLPWLASWLNLALDERLSEAQQRRLIQSMASLYRKRGTRQGLQEYLEIYTGEWAEVIEHRANDLRLGPEARLGPGVALGKGNWPHTFTVVLRLSPISVPADDEGERARRELERRRTLEAIIEAEKPAHTGYTLHIESKV